MYKLLVLVIVNVIFFSCGDRKDNSLNSVTFDVGFEEFKTYQGIYKDNSTGEEEIFFVKTDFNPIVKFYNLSGELKETISLDKVREEIGRIGRVSIISKDTIIIASYSNAQLVAMKKDGSYWFNINMDSLSRQVDSKNIYRFWGTLFPAPINLNNDILLIPVWYDEGEDKNVDFDSDFAQYQYMNEQILRTPQICKIDSLFSDSPNITFGLSDFYYNLFPSKIYNLTASAYAILNNKLFFLTAYSRDLYELDFVTLQIKNTIKILPDEYKIPTGIELEKETMYEDKSEKIFQELSANCYVTNFLYDINKRRYYIFLKTDLDISVVDELGYPFKVFIYDENWNKEKEILFSTREYNPKSAMMTHRGIIIEKIKKDKQYGKRTFEFINL